MNVGNGPEFHGHRENAASFDQDYSTIVVVDVDLTIGSLLRDDPDRIASTTGEVELSSGPSRLRRVHGFAITVFVHPRALLSRSMMMITYVHHNLILRVSRQEVIRTLSAGLQLKRVSGCGFEKHVGLRDPIRHRKSIITS